MTSENNGLFQMPVMPAYGMGGNGGFGFGDGNGWWILLLLLLAGNGGWGFGGGFGGMGGMMWPMMMGGMGAGFGLDYLYPWLNNSEHISDGFRDQQIQSTLTGIQSSVTSGFGNVQNALCQGFAGTTAAVTGAQNAIAQQLYSNEIANLNRSFAEQTSNTQGFNNVQAQLASCCCDNKTTALENRYALAQEACATRTASATNTRDIIDSQNRGTQAILDKLCQLELDGVKGQLADANNTIGQLRTQLLVANNDASQTAQTARILAGQTAEVDALYNRLSNCPVPTVPVYGRQPIFTCNNGCGCGNNGFAA